MFASACSLVLVPLLALHPYRAYLLELDAHLLELDALRANLRYECDAGAECPPFNNSFLAVHTAIYARGLTPAFHVDPRWGGAARGLMGSRAGSAAMVNFLVLGSNSMREDFKQFELLSPWSSQIRATFVEPNPHLHKDLWLNLQRAGFDLANSNVVSAAMCDSGPRSLKFYICTADTSESSLIPDLATDVPACRGEDAIQTLDVQCMTALGLLEHEGLKASDVDILHLDIEGLDVPVLDQFLAMEGFQPRVVMYEFGGMQQYEPSNFNIDRINSLLAARGYDVHQDGLDMIAISSRPL